MPFTQPSKRVVNKYGDLACGCRPVKTQNGNYIVCKSHMNPVDLALRKKYPSGMRDGVDVTIKFSIGFEDFGSYEDWGQGYVIEGIDLETGNTIRASDKYLTQAIDKFINKPYIIGKNE